MFKAVSGAMIVLMSALLLSNNLHAKEGSNPLEKERREIGTFNSVTVHGNGTLYIIHGNKEALFIEAEREILTNINSEVQNNCLSLGPKENSTTQNKTINYYLTIKQLNRLEASGNLEIIAKDNINGEEFNLALLGFCKARIKLKTDKFKLQLSGAGSVLAQGNADEQNIQISGEAEFNGKKLLTKIAHVTINGSGNAEVNVIKELNVNIEGAGKIKYYGNPKIIQQISGEGEIIPLG